MKDIRSDKLILVDCDGVLLDWKYSFYKFMAENGYTIQVEDVYDVATTFNIPRSEAKQLVRQFNESARIGFLPGLRDSIKYVKKYNIHIIFISQFKFGIIYAINLRD